MLSDRRRIGVGAALDRIVDDAERAAPPGDAGVDPDREILAPAGGFPAAGGAAVARQPKAKGFAEERTADDVADTPAKALGELFGVRGGNYRHRRVVAHEPRREQHARIGAF